MNRHFCTGCFNFVVISTRDSPARKQIVELSTFGLFLNNLQKTFTRRTNCLIFQSLLLHSVCVLRKIFEILRYWYNKELSTLLHEFPTDWRWCECEGNELSICSNEMNWIELSWIESSLFTRKKKSAHSSEDICHNINRNTYAKTATPNEFCIITVFNSWIIERKKSSVYDDFVCALYCRTHETLHSYN